MLFCSISIWKKTHLNIFPFWCYWYHFSFLSVDLLPLLFRVHSFIHITHFILAEQHRNVPCWASASWSHVVGCKHVLIKITFGLFPVFFLLLFSLHLLLLNWWSLFKGERPAVTFKPWDLTHFLNFLKKNSFKCKTWRCNAGKTHLSSKTSNHFLRCIIIFSRIQTTIQFNNKTRKTQTDKMSTVTHIRSRNVLE